MRPRCFPDIDDQRPLRKLGASELLEVVWRWPTGRPGVTPLGRSTSHSCNNLADFHVKHLLVLRESCWLGQGIQLWDSSPRRLLRSVPAMYRLAYGAELKSPVL